MVMTIDNSSADDDDGGDSNKDEAADGVVDRYDTSTETIMVNLPKIGDPNIVITLNSRIHIIRTPKLRYPNELSEPFGATPFHIGSKGPKGVLQAGGSLKR